MADVKGKTRSENLSTGKSKDVDSSSTITDETTPKTQDAGVSTDSKETLNTKDNASDHGSEADDESHYTTSKPKEPKITEEPEQLPKDAKNPLDELKAGLKAGEEDKGQSPASSDKKADMSELAPLSEEEMAKLTPGKGVDLDKLLSEKKAEGGEVTKDVKGAVDDVAEKGGKTVDDVTDKGKETTDEATKTADETSEDVAKKGDEATDGAKDKLNDTTDAAAEKGEETTEDTTKAAEDTIGDVAKEGEKAKDDAAKEGEDLGKDADKAADDLPKDGDDAADQAEDIAKDAEEGKDGDLPNDGDLPSDGEDAVKQGEETVKEGEETAKDGVDDVTKEGDEAVKEGEETLKEGEEAGKDGVEGVAKEGEDVVKEGEEAAEGAAEEVPDLSILKGGKVNKGGNVVDGDGKVVGRIKEGVLAHLVGKRVDENGIIWNDSGKQIGVAELIPDDEREALTKEAAPFESFPDAVVDGEGYVVFNEERIGKVVEGDIKKLRGMKVDADGDILDRGGNVVGKAERWEPEKEPEPEPEPEVDCSMLAGKRVNKAGNVVDGSGVIFGRVVEGDPAKMVGRMCDKKGNILSEGGDILGKAVPVSESEREGQKEGPFAELSGCTVAKDGTVVTPGGDIVGRLIKGDPKVLFGRLVDEDGDVVDKNGNVLGKAERWEPEPEPEKKKNALSGRKVNREGNVVDEDGNLVGKLTTGDLSICAGKEIDDDGDVVDGKGNTIGHVSLIEDIPEVKEEESPEDKQKREQSEQDKKLAQQMAYCLTQCLDKVKPICSMITSKIEAAERKPKEELDEEQLVKDVRPLIEEGGKILQEANGIIRGLDPDGRIQANAKHKTATREATPEEYQLAEILKELTTTVSKTIDDAKKKIEGMPHAKKELNPLWGLLSEPLFEIMAAVGLLLDGVLGIVGRLLSGLGLGGLVDGLLGTLGVKNILGALGLGGVTDSLTGQKDGKKKKGGLLGLGG